MSGYDRFTDQARKVMQHANSEAQRFNHEYIGTEHILLGLVRVGVGVAANVLKNLEISLPVVRLEIEKMVQPGPEAAAPTGKLPKTPRAAKVTEYAIEEARNLNHNYVGTEHLLLGLLHDEETVAAQVLLNLGLKLNTVRTSVLELLGNLRETCGNQPSLQLGHFTLQEEPKTPNLDLLGRDLTALARRGKLDPVIGREREIERVLLVLGCRTQNVPLLVGPPGVGKSAIVRGLALVAVQDGAPKILGDRRVVVLNLARMVLVTKDRGDLLTKAIQSVAEECRQFKNVLLYLDDMLAFGSSGKVLLSAFLAERIPCLLTTTPGKYASLAGDPLLDRHCQKIPVEPPPPEVAVEILRGLRPGLQEHHQVQIGDDALTAAVQMAERHLTEGVLPGKALQVLGQACTLVRITHEPRRPELNELERQIEGMIHEKEGAVAEMDFEKAAGLRDQADKLKQKKERILRAWHLKSPETVGTVDAAAVGRVIDKMTGGAFRSE
jgi:ATP-dependent Clp protease ATP-binding subunit ClpC